MMSYLKNNHYLEVVDKTLGVCQLVVGKFYPSQRWLPNILHYFIWKNSNRCTLVTCAHVHSITAHMTQVGASQSIVAGSLVVIVIINKELTLPFRVQPHRTARMAAVLFHTNRDCP